MSGGGAKLRGGETSSKLAADAVVAKSGPQIHRETDRSIKTLGSASQRPKSGSETSSEHCLAL